MTILDIISSKTKNKKELNKLFLIITVILAILGTVAVYTAGYAYATYRYGDAAYFAKRQTVWLLCGLVTMLATSNIPLRTVKRFVPIGFIISLLLLLLTLFIGMVGNGAQRWISIGPITVQPSEIAKLGLILALAKYFEDKEDKLLNRKSKKDT